MLNLNKTISLNDITNNIKESTKQGYEYTFYSNFVCQIFSSSIKESFFNVTINNIVYTFRLLNNEKTYTLVSCFDELNFKELKIN